MSGKLVKNTICLYLVTAAKIIGPLVTLPWLTRSLSVDTYGVVAYVKAYASYMQLLLDFGFLLSATKDIALSLKDSGVVGRIVGDTLVEKLILAATGAVITCAAILFIPILAENVVFTWLYYLSCVATLLILDFLFRGLEKMEYVAIPLCCAKVFVVIVTIALVDNDQDMFLVPLIEIVGNLFAGAISLFFFWRLGIHLNFSGLKRWFHDLRVSGVYFLSNFATTFLGAMTTLVVGVVMSTTDIAFWSVCMMVVAAAKSMYAPLGNSLYPHMVVHKDLGLVRKVARTFTAPLVVCCVVVLFFGSELMALIGGESYAAAGEPLKMLVPVLAFSFYSTLLGWPSLGVVGGANKVTFTTVAAAVLQTITIGCLVVFDSLTLASLALCCGLSELCLLVLRFAFLRKVLVGVSRAS